MSHPTVPELVTAGDTPPEPLAAHLAGCASCRRVAAQVRAVTRALPPRPGVVDLELPIVDPAVYARRVDLAEARGGMGRTFVAVDRRLGREVAIKQPLGAAEVADPTLRATLRARFEREARLTARLEHPAIVAVHEAGRFADGDAFYAMRRVQGTSLAEEVLAARPALAERLALLPNLTLVAEALAYAHRQGVIHRDVTPANIMIGAFGETVLIDWGLAADDGGHAIGAEPTGPYRAGELPLTAYGVGTPGYIAPEQARGGAPDARADVYALGATLYHVVAGAPPAPTPRPLAATVPEAPAPLVALIERAMAPDPAGRFAGAAELAAELRRFTAGQLMASHRYSPGELARHYLRRYRAPFAVAAAALLVLVVGVALYVRGQARARSVTDRARRAAETSEATAQRALRRALGVTASQLAADPERRLEALAAGVDAVAPALRAGEAPAAEAWQGLVDALAVGPLAAPLAGRRGSIGVPAFTPDGRLLITVGIDHYVHLWDGRSGRAVGRRATALARPIHLAISPDGARLVVCGYDPIAEIHALAGGAPWRMPLPAGDARCVVSPDGGAVFAAGRDVFLVAADGTPGARAVLPAAITALAVAPDGRLALGTVAGDVALWRPGGAPPRAIHGHAGGTQALHFTAGGAGLVSGGADGRARAWTVGADGLVAGEDLLAPRPGPVSAMYPVAGGAGVALLAPSTRTDQRAIDTIFVSATARLAVSDFTFAPDALGGDARLLAGTGGGRPRLIDAASGQDVVALPAARTFLTAVARADTVLLSAAAGGAALLWDLRSGPATGLLLGHTGEIAALVTAGDRLWSGAHDGTVRTWALAAATAAADDDDRAPTVWTQGSEVRTVRLSPDRTTLAVLDLDGRVALGGVEPTARWRPLAADRTEPIEAVAFSPDGGRLVTVTTAGRARLWDVTSGALAATFAVAATAGAPGADLTAAAYASDGRRLALGAADGAIALLDLATGTVTARHVTAPGPDGRVEGIERLAFTPDGAALVVGFAAARTLVLDGATLAPRAQLDGRAGGDATDALLDRGAVVTFALDGRVLLHPLAGGPPRVLDGHLRPVLRAAASADGRRLVTTDVDGLVRLWSTDGDAASRQAVLAFTPADLGPITALGFVDGDRALALGSARGELRIVPLAPELAVARACARLAYFERVAAACPAPP